MFPRELPINIQYTAMLPVNLNRHFVELQYILLRLYHLLDVHYADLEMFNDRRE